MNTFRDIAFKTRLREQKHQEIRSSDDVTYTLFFKKLNHIRT